MMMRAPRDSKNHHSSKRRLLRPYNPYMRMWADEFGGEKSWIRRMLAEREESLGGELEGPKSAVKSQDTASLEVRSLMPGALVCVPDEPVSVPPRAVGAEILFAQDDGFVVPVEERYRDSSF